MAAYRRTHGPSRLAWSEGWRCLAPNHIHQMNRVNCHDARPGIRQHSEYHSLIIIVIVTTTTIIIIIIIFDPR